MLSSSFGHLNGWGHLNALMVHSRARKPPPSCHCFSRVAVIRMAFPFLANLPPFTLESLRRDGIFMGEVPHDQDLRSALSGNSVDSKRIAEVLRYDLSGPGRSASVVRPYATMDSLRGGQELVNPEFLAMHLCSRHRQLPVAQWHLKVADEELSACDEGVFVIPAEITDRDMLQSGNWAIWWALKNHEFDAINQDFLLWSKLHSMIAAFHGASEGQATEQMLPTDGVPLDDPRLVSVRRNVKRRRDRQA